MRKLENVARGGKGRREVSGLGGRCFYALLPRLVSLCAELLRFFSFSPLSISVLFCFCVFFQLVILGCAVWSDCVSKREFFIPSGNYETWAACQVMFPHSKIALSYLLNDEDRDEVLNRATVANTTAR